MKNNSVNTKSESRLVGANISLKAEGKGQHGVAVLECEGGVESGPGSQRVKL